MSEQEHVEWQKIADRLTNYFNICKCQRKIKSIIDNLYSIYTKCNEGYEDSSKRDFTGAEWLVISILDAHTNAITHGVNCEYPIINEQDELWEFVLLIKDSPHLKDN